MESMSKYVECEFGILKGRWRILKTVVCLHSTQAVDQVWLTCCAFHNMLLDIDGLDDQWDGRQVNTSEWERELGDLEEGDVPLSMMRVLNPTQIHQYDTSIIGLDNEDESGSSKATPWMTSYEEMDGSEVESSHDAVDNNDYMEKIRLVCHLSLIFFRSRLVEHFNIQFRRRELMLPHGRGPKPSAYFDCN